MEDYKIEIEDKEVAIDYVHLLVSFPPRYSIAEVVGLIKSKSVRRLFCEFPRVKRRLWAGELWGDGYFAQTVGNRMTRQTIEKYIKHHRDIEQWPAQLS